MRAERGFLFWGIDDGALIREGVKRIVTGSLPTPPCATNKIETTPTQLTDANISLRIY